MFQVKNSWLSFVPKNRSTKKMFHNIQFTAFLSEICGEIDLYTHLIFLDLF